MQAILTLTVMCRYRVLAYLCLDCLSTGGGYPRNGHTYRDHVSLAAFFVTLLKLRILH